MVEHISPEEERWLGDCLKRDAQADRPSFSPDLHKRIRRAVGAAGRPTPRQPAPDWFRRNGLPAVVAAACLAGVWVMAWRVSLRPGDDINAPTVAGKTEPIEIAPGPHDEPGPEPPRLDVPEVAVQKGILLVDNSLTTRQWAYLDHDARVATKLLIDQFPIHLASRD